LQFSNLDFSDFWNHATLTAVVQFLYSAGLYNSLKYQIVSDDIPMNNSTGFVSNNCAIMTGQKQWFPGSAQGGCT